MNIQSEAKISKMGNSGSVTEWGRTFREIKSNHDSAYFSIEEAIKLEERERPEEALEKYKEGIKYIDSALSIQVTCPQYPEQSWDKAIVMIQKMKKTRAEVLMRINSLQVSQGDGAACALPEPPPSYDEAMSSASSTSDEMPRTYKDLATALHELQIDPNQNMDTEIIYKHEKVKLYFISPSGQVLSTSEPETLKICLIHDEASNVPRAILQVGDWVYPLVPGVSPCYRTEYGAFILPNVYADEPGSCVGIILPPDADDDVYDLLESILHGIISQSAEKEYRKGKKEIPVVEEEDLSKRISNNLVNGAWVLSRGIIKGAEKATQLLDENTPRLMNRIRPSREPARVPRKLSRGMELAENTTGKAAELTGFVADKVSFATMKLGRFLAPHVQKGGTRLLTTVGFSEQEASSKMTGVLTVAAGAVEGFSTVYQGLETSAKILGHNLKNNTVKVVQHKYGLEAGELTGGTLDTVGNVININNNAKIIKPKHLVKRAAKDTGKALIANYSAASTSTSSSEQNQISPNEEKGNVLEKQ